MPAFTPINFNSVKEKLLQSGITITQQRLVIYQALMQLDHPTADTTYDLIWLLNPFISLGTVYKTWDIFSDDTLFCKRITKEGRMRYDAHTQPHSHMYAINSKEIADSNHLELYQQIGSCFKRHKMHHLKIKSPLSRLVHRKNKSQLKYSVITKN